MSSGDWWYRIRAHAALVRRPFLVLTDRAAMARHVPELVDKTEHEAIDYIQAQLDGWHRACTPQQAETFARRLKGAHESWRAMGAPKPYWSDLWVLRTYQAELAGEKVMPSGASGKPR